MRFFDFQAGRRTVFLFLICALSSLLTTAGTIHVDLTSSVASFVNSSTFTEPLSGATFQVSARQGLLFPVTFGNRSGVGIIGIGGSERVDGPSSLFFGGGEVISVEFLQSIPGSLLLFVDYIIVDDMNFSEVCSFEGGDPLCFTSGATAFISSDPLATPSPGQGDYVLQVDSGGTFASYGSFLFGGATVETINPATGVGTGGRWKILDPFGGQPVNGFAMTGGDTRAFFLGVDEFVTRPDGFLLSAFGFRVAPAVCEVTDPECDGGGEDPGNGGGTDPGTDPGNGGPGGTDPAAIPEPSTWAMLAGAFGVLVVRRFAIRSRT